MTDPRPIESTAPEPPSEDQLLEVEIESLAYGGEGVAHAPRAIFVAGAAPGDRLRLRVREDHGRWARADVVEILHPSPDRRPPPCPIAGTCGGCQWQHVVEASQRAAKRQAVEDALRRIGGLEEITVPPLLVAGPPLGYRRRARLQLRLAGGEFVLGFHAPGSQGVVDIPDCIQMSDGLRRAHAALRAALAAAGAPSGVAEIELAVGSEDGPGVAAFRMSRRAPRGARAQLEKVAAAAVSSDGLQGLAVLGPFDRLIGQWGDVTISHQVSAGTLPGAPYMLRQRAWSFAQAGWEANQLLVRTVIEALGEPPPRRLLELYAGSGNFTVPLSALCGEVTAVEGDPQATQDLCENLARAGSGAHVLALPVERAFRRVAAVDAVLLDPPRGGAAAALPGLTALNPARIVYVACDPATLARDLRTLTGEGYRVAEVKALDLFPQTYHVEVVATCIRKEA